MREYRQEVTQDMPTFYLSRDRWEGNWLCSECLPCRRTFWLGDAQRDVTWQHSFALLETNLGEAV